MTRPGKHRWTRVYDEYVDAAYTATGQRAVRLLIAAAVIVLANLALLVLLLIHVV